MDIVDQLESLGLNGRQSRVYLALLQLGQASAIDLAKSTKFKHPTVYDVLDVLESRGLIGKTRVNGRNLYHAEDPQALERLEEARRRTLTTLLPELKQLYLTGSHHTRVHCFDGETGLRTVYRELLEVPDREYRYFGSIREMLKLTSVNDEWRFFRERIRRRIVSWSIRQKTGETDVDFLRPGEENLRRVRYFPYPLPDNISGLYLYSGKVAIISALKENYTVIIESDDLYRLLKSVWQGIWEVSEVIPQK